MIRDISLQQENIANYLNQLISSSNRVFKTFNDLITWSDINFDLTRDEKSSLNNLFSEFLTRLVKCFLSPLINNKCFQVYHDLTCSNIKIKISLILTDSRILFNGDLTNVCNILKKSLIGWNTTTFIELPALSFDCTPLNHQVFKNVVDELIDSSESSFMLLLDQLSNDIKPRLNKLNELIMYCDDFENIDKISRWNNAFEIIKNLETMTRVLFKNFKSVGIFNVDFTFLHNQITSILNETRLKIKNQVSTTFTSKIKKLLKTRVEYLNTAVPTTYQLTRQSALQLQELKSLLPDLKSIRIEIFDLYDYLCKLMVDVSDQDVDDYFKCFGVLDEMMSFYDARFLLISDNMVKLKFAIAKEIEAFLGLWKSMGALLNELFQPVKSNDKVATTSEELTHLKLVEKNLVNAFGVVSLIQKKVDSIKEYQYI